MGDPDFWNDGQAAQQLIEETNGLKEKRDNFLHLQDGIENLQVTLSLLQEEADSEMQIEFENDLATMTSLLEKYRLEQLLDEPYDQNNAIIEIHPGAGGTESQDWLEINVQMVSVDLNT